MMGERGMASEATLLTVQFLRWVAARPRRYAEMREAWGSTCPLTCAWEDAIADNLVRRTADGRLALTEQGRERLDAAALLDGAGRVS
jgi:hypothetical protein